MFNAVAPSPLNDDSCDRRPKCCCGTGIMNKSTAMSINLTSPCKERLVKLSFSVPESDAVHSYTYMQLKAKFVLLDKILDSNGAFPIVVSNGTRKHF